MLALSAESIDVARCLADLTRDGYAHLGPVLSDDARAQLSERLDDLMHGRVRHDGLFFQHDSPTGRYEDLRFGDGWVGPSARYRKLEKLERDPLFAAWIGNPLFERIARAYIEGPVALYRALVFTKAAHGGTHLPFHQDGGAFWGVDRAPTLQLWTALDDSTRASGCLEVIPGTHLRGLTTPDGGVVPDDCLVASDAARRIVYVEARAGEGLLIHNHLWHRSGINRTDQRRAAISVCLMSAETRCLRRRRTPRSFPVIFGAEQSESITAT